MMLANSLVTTDIRIRDIIEMYNAAERPQDLDEIVVKVPSVVAVSRALANRDGRASDFSSFLDGCVKPSDVFARPYNSQDDPENWHCKEAHLFDESDDEPFNYGYINPYGVACDLAKRWIADGYCSLWLRSDKRVFKSRGMIGNGDDFRRGDRRPRPGGRFLAPLTAQRVALTNKNESGGAIANAIRLGQRIPELCEPVKIHPQPVAPVGRSATLPSMAPPTEIERIPVDDLCPTCRDPFCVCVEMGRVTGGLAA